MCVLASGYHWKAGKVKQPSSAIKDFVYRGLTVLGTLWPLSYWRCSNGGINMLIFYSKQIGQPWEDFKADKLFEKSLIPLQKLLKHCDRKYHTVKCGFSVVWMGLFLFCFLKSWKNSNIIVGTLKSALYQNLTSSLCTWAILQDNNPKH